MNNKSILGYAIAAIMLFGMTTAWIYVYYSVTSGSRIDAVLSALAFLVLLVLFLDWLVIKDIL